MIRDPPRTSPFSDVRLGYVCGALRVTTDEASESIGPRAHVVGFLGGLRAAGVAPRLWLAGDETRLRAAAPGTGEAMSKGALRRAAVDGVRLGLRYAMRRRAAAAVGPVDLVYERQSTFNDLGRAFRRRGARWVVESNGPFWYEAGEERKSLALVGVARRLELAAYRDADLVVAVSEPLKEIIVRESGRDPDAVHVLPNATDPSRFDPDAVAPRRLAPADIPAVGFVGYLTPWAGLDALVRAAAELRRAGRALDVVLIGGGPHRAALERLAAEEGIADHVHFTGHVGWREVPPLLAGLDVAFSGQRQMGIGAMYHSPQKLYEYHAMALPVVASAHDDARRLLGAADSGWLFASDDREGLRRALDAAITEDPAARAERGRRGRRVLLSGHTWEVRVRQLLEELDRRGMLRPPAGHADRPARA